jgi:transposase-like protein
MEGTPEVASHAETVTPEAKNSAITVPQVVDQEAHTVIAVEHPREEQTQPTRRRAGRPRTIKTDHVCCPHEGCDSSAVLGPHPDHDIVGCGTYMTVHGEERQLYLCKVCNQTFSETAGTPFFGLKTPTKTVCIALNELAEGLGVRAVARIHRVKPETILDWLRKAGEHCARLSECMMQDLELTQVQLGNRGGNGKTTIA